MRRCRRQSWCEGATAARDLGREDPRQPRRQPSRIGPQDALLDRGDLRRVHREAAQAHRQQQLGEGRVAGHLAADADAACPAAGAARWCGDQPQDGRMPGVVEVRHVLVGAVDGQRVLDQVVGADGDEVEVLQEAVDQVSAAAGTSIMAPTSMSAKALPGIAQLLLGPLERVEGRRDLAAGGPPSGSAIAPCRRHWRAGWRAAAGGTCAAPTSSSGWHAGPAPGSAHARAAGRARSSGRAACRRRCRPCGWSPAGRCRPSTASR